MFKHSVIEAKHFKIYYVITCNTNYLYSRWPSGLVRGFAAVRLLGLRVRILPGAWMFVCYECCVLYRFCDLPIPHLGDFYRVTVIKCDNHTLHLQ
jgi:hypothetical protein